MKLKLFIVVCRKLQTGRAIILEYFTINLQSEFSDQECEEKKQRWLDNKGHITTAPKKAKLTKLTTGKSNAFVD